MCDFCLESIYIDGHMPQNDIVVVTIVIVLLIVTVLMHPVLGFLLSKMAWPCLKRAIIWSFQKLVVPFFGGTKTTDYHVWGSIFGRCRPPRPPGLRLN